MTTLIKFDWHDNRQDMSCLQVWWHHYRHKVSLQKKPIIFILPLSFLSFSQTYWSRIQITDANRRWAWLKSEEGTWKRRRRRREKRNGERETDRQTDAGIVTSEPSPRPLSSLSLMKWSVFALISIPGDFGINHRCKIKFVQGYMKMFYILHVCVWLTETCCVQQAYRDMQENRTVWKVISVHARTHTWRKRETEREQKRELSI